MPEQLGRGGVRREGVTVDHAEVRGRRGCGALVRDGKAAAEDILVRVCGRSSECTRGARARWLRSCGTPYSTALVLSAAALEAAILSKWTGAAESFYLALLTVCQRVNVPWRATSAKVVKMKLKLARAWYFCKSQIKSEIRVSDIRYNGKNVNVPSLNGDLSW